MDRTEFIIAGIVLVPAVLVICVLVGVIRIYRKAREEVNKRWLT